MNSVVADTVGDCALIITVAWLLGGLVRCCGQPTVIGQILAGILLGPSVLWRLPGQLTGHLFPVLPGLTVVAQFAVTAFMFGVGYEIDLGTLRDKGGRLRSSRSARSRFPLGSG